jgi:hypothetical protein
MKNKYLFFLIFFLSTPFLLNAQGNNEINWCVFSNGFGGQSNSSSIITTMAGEPIAGISKNDALNLPEDSYPDIYLAGNLLH